MRVGPWNVLSAIVYVLATFFSHALGLFPISLIPIRSSLFAQSHLRPALALYNRCKLLCGPSLTGQLNIIYIFNDEIQLIKYILIIFSFLMNFKVIYKRNFFLLISLFLLIAHDMFRIIFFMINISNDKIIYVYFIYMLNA